MEPPPGSGSRPSRATRRRKGVSGEDRLEMITEGAGALPRFGSASKKPLRSVVPLQNPMQAWSTTFPARSPSRSTAARLPRAPASIVVSRRYSSAWVCDRGSVHLVSGDVS